MSNTNIPHTYSCPFCHRSFEYKGMGDELYFPVLSVNVKLILRMSFLLRSRFGIRLKQKCSGTEEK